MAPPPMPADVSAEILWEVNLSLVTQIESLSSRTLDLQSKHDMLMRDMQDRCYKVIELEIARTEMQDELSERSVSIEKLQKQLEDLDTELKLSWAQQQDCKSQADTAMYEAAVIAHRLEICKDLLHRHSIALPAGVSESKGNENEEGADGMNGVEGIVSAYDALRRNNLPLSPFMSPGKTGLIVFKSGSESMAARYKLPSIRGGTGATPTRNSHASPDPLVRNLASVSGLGSLVGRPLNDILEENVVATLTGTASTGGGLPNVI
jgi:hypothetical protein